MSSLIGWVETLGGAENICPYREPDLFCLNKHPSAFAIDCRPMACGRDSAVICAAVAMPVDAGYGFEPADSTKPRGCFSPWGCFRDLNGPDVVPNWAFNAAVKQTEAR